MKYSYILLFFSILHCNICYTVPSHAVFRATMSRNRFAALKGNLRFDDPLRRDRNDPIAPVRDIMTSFISSLRQYVTAPEYLCIDEQLLEYHGRVRFRQYIPSKPGKKYSGSLIRLENIVLMDWYT